ncbi:uncharacterized protein LOC142817153 isoform X2 [Rhipicephalus microplus]|uniref:uncharacterized protein LOC142817153 isoform X2 n=1 Tax=Rhipicephalus microplus TaxID=6941 RepID=UPI003F6B8BDA
MWACSPPPRNCSYQCTVGCLTTLNLPQVSGECVITESKLIGQNPRKKIGLKRDH